MNDDLVNSQTLYPPIHTGRLELPVEAMGDGRMMVLRPELGAFY